MFLRAVRIVIERILVDITIVLMRISLHSRWCYVTCASCDMMQYFDVVNSSVEHDFNEPSA